MTRKVGKKTKTAHRESQAPVWCEGGNVGVWLSSAMSWYSRHSTPSQQKKWLLTWVEEWNRNTFLPFTEDAPFSQAQMVAIRFASPDDCIGLGSIAKILLDGGPVDDKTRQKFLSQARNLKPATVKSKKTIAKSQETADKELIAITTQIEETIDVLARNPKDILWKRQLTESQKDSVVQHCKPLYDDLIAVAEESDADLQDAYRNIPPRCIDAMLRYLEDIFNVPTVAVF